VQNVCFLSAYLALVKDTVTGIAKCSWYLKLFGISGLSFADMRRLLGKISPLLRAPIVARAAGRGVAPEAIRFNHLKGSASSYLSRASRQPVDWYPWREEAFRRAEGLDLPIIVDLGAEWCPYCAQMDRESYNRPDLAKFINDRFVAVKVDYDMQPELAVRLQRAQAFMNLPVGLPLTAFLTPSGKLYFSGGYFPPEARGKKPALREALEDALCVFQEHREVLERGGFDVRKPEGDQFHE